VKTTNNINLYNWLVCFLIYINSATILVPDKFKAWPIGLLLLTVIVRYFKLNGKPILETKKFLVSIGFFIVLVFSITYSSDISFAIRKLETGASLFIFPLIFYIVGADKVLFTEKTIQTLKLTFIFSLIFFLISTFSFFYFTEPFYTFKSTLVHYTNLVDIRIKHYEIHSIYLSIYIGVAIIFALSIIRNCKPSLRKILFFVLLLLIIFMAILNKKGPIISLGIVGFIVLIKNKFNYKRILYLSSISIILILFIIYVPKYNNVNKFSELWNVENFKSNNNSSTGIRIQIYQCAIKKIVQSPIYGYGWGDTKKVLNDCYSQKNENLLKRNYNSHNQFLSILLSVGVLGFLAFLYYLFYVLKISNKRKSQLLFLLTLYFCLNMLTENILEREDGVIIIALFISVFLFSPNKEADELSNKT
jgi:O-antigen ligase